MIFFYFSLSLSLSLFPILQWNRARLWSWNWTEFLVVASGRCDCWYACAFKTLCKLLCLCCTLCTFLWILQFIDWIPSQHCLFSSRWSYFRHTYIYNCFFSLSFSFHTRNSLILFKRMRLVCMCVTVWLCACRWRKVCTQNMNTNADPCICVLNINITRYTTYIIYLCWWSISPKNKLKIKNNQIQSMHGILCVALSYNLSANLGTTRAAYSFAPLSFSSKPGIVRQRSYQALIFG